MSATAAATRARAAKILVIDDEPGLRDFLCYELGARGYEVVAAASGAEGLERLKSKDFELVLSDVRMPGMDGISLLKEIKRTDPRVEVILSTGYGTIEKAIEAMKEGAFDFLLKPLETEPLATVVRRALETGELKAQLALYESSLALFRSIDLAEVLPLIADLARRLLDADRAVILLRDGPRLKTGSESPCGAAGPDLTALLEAADRMTRGGETGLACAPAESAELAAAAGTVQALLVQPLAAGGKNLGFLAAVRVDRADRFSTRDLRHAAMFAAQAAQAVRNAELFRELQAAQDRLVQSEKLGAVGRVAAGIAHEINNPLTVVLGNIELVLSNPDVDAQDREDLASAAEQARHCAEIVRNLLEFVRQREPRKETFDLYPILESALAMAALGQPLAVKTVRRWPPRSPRLNADPLQLKQVVVNLARNAYQAMEGSMDRELTVSVEAMDGRVALRIEDRGGGIPDENLGRLFEPFFTTKAPGKGTGLGLYLCRLLIERQGGEIAAGNREGGGGAAFTVTLPAAR